MFKKIAIEVIALILNTICFMSMVIGCGDDKKPSTDDNIDEIHIKEIQVNGIEIKENVITENILVEETIH